VPSELADMGSFWWHSVGLLNFHALAFFAVDQDGLDFPLIDVDPEPEAAAIREELEVQIRDGVFAWALRRAHPVIVPAPMLNGSVMLHALATRSRVTGIFLGVLSDRYPFVPDACELQRSNRTLGSQVTERTRELELATKAALAASRAKREFLANMSHEIRTPGVPAWALPSRASSPS
jgi:signal transduction histidine kinase